MNKAERLFHLTTLLKSRRTAVTAEVLAEKLEVSVRTVYRDIQALIVSGIPVEGEAGIGYRLTPGFEVPPLMFRNDELQALLVGIRMVKAFTDPELGAAASLAEDKILSVLPDRLKGYAENQPYCIPVMSRDDPKRARHLEIRRACEQMQKLSIAYRDEQGQQTERVIWPLGLVSWGDRWTLVAWCELRQDYRHFRFDRIASLQPLGEFFETSETLSLKHFLSTVDAD
ncbi:helix-turn-helix transcriptional regulator [Litoribrevibacter albus]|uniref:DNA-binding transcriptional regulator n=1 Tax=Litoribrevibacter albus TaxID=1473156 RepID=A0AA37S7N7_9GAMM|nr:YafY family protein [Litoribrevibacter albus]GLQ29569.1 DNA-binding transcriptional regulator [Litoribrevibacter albus]